MTRIDAHLHLWDPALGVHHWLTPDLGPLHRAFTAEQARAELDAAGVDTAVLVQAADDARDTLALLDEAATQPWIVGVVGWIDLERPDQADDRLAELSATGWLSGIRQLTHDDPRAGVLTRSDVVATARRLARHGIPLDVPDAFPRDLADGTALATAVPDLVVVLDHLGKPPRGRESYAVWREQLRDFAERPNTVAKVSGLWQADQPWTADDLRPTVELALDCFGTERLMLGSDWPMTIAGPGYEDTVSILDTVLAGLSGDELTNLWSATATRVYHLREGEN